MAVGTRSTAVIAAAPSGASKANNSSRTKPKAPASAIPKTPRASNNRVRKATPPRGRHGHYVVDTSRTASPDYVPETPPSSQRRHRYVEETPPPSSSRALNEAEEEIARLKEQLRYGRYRPHKSRSHRHRRRQDESSSESEDSEAGVGPRVSFKQDPIGNQPFLSLHEHYRAVDIKWFKQIYFGTFKPKYLQNLSHTYAHWSVTTKSSKKDEDTINAANMMQLLRCFEVYAHAICYFAARPHVALKLHEALISYRIRLSDFSGVYRFDSIRIYHYSFMAARILHGQDDPVAWATENPTIFQYLVPKATTAVDSKAYSGNAAGKSTTAGGNGTCNNFNNGHCSYERCKYSHICSICQQNHSALTCTKTRTPASNTNFTPLGNRVTRPHE